MMDVNLRAHEMDLIEMKCHQEGDQERARVSCFVFLQRWHARKGAAFIFKALKSRFKTERLKRNLKTASPSGAKIQRLEEPSSTRNVSGYSRTKWYGKT